LVAFLGKEPGGAWGLPPEGAPAAPSVRRTGCTRGPQPVRACVPGPKW